MSKTHPSGTDRDFERFAGTCALIVGLGGIAYAITFVVVLRGSAGRVSLRRMRFSSC